jgi:hypothetical protein
MGSGQAISGENNCTFAGCAHTSKPASLEPEQLPVVERSFHPLTLHQMITHCFIHKRVNQ